MYYLYKYGKKLTIDPVSFDFLIRHLLFGLPVNQKAISELEYDTHYSYDRYVIVRAG